MINDDSLVKYAVGRLKENYSPGSEYTIWPDYVRLLRRQIDEIKLGFPGIGDGDLEICRSRTVAPGQRVILDERLDLNFGRLDLDTAPILGLILSIIDQTAVLEVEGIGRGMDLERDPDRRIRPGVILEVPLGSFQCILRMTAVPRDNGGSVYYYYNKHPRDSRY